MVTGRTQIYPPPLLFFKFFSPFLFPPFSVLNSLPLVDIVFYQTKENVENVQLVIKKKILFNLRFENIIELCQCRHQTSKQIVLK